MSSIAPIRFIGTCAANPCDPLLLFGLVEAVTLAGRHRRAHESGRDAVDPHPSTRELARDVARVAEDRTLGRRVGRTADAHRRRDRRHVHDRTAPAVEHRRDRRPRAHVDAPEVDLEHGVPLLPRSVSHVSRSSPCDDAGVVHEHVEPAEARRATSRPHAPPAVGASRRRRPPDAASEPSSYELRRRSRRRGPRRGRRPRPARPHARSASRWRGRTRTPPPVTIAALPVQSTVTLASSARPRSRRAPARRVMRQ